MLVETFPVGIKNSGCSNNFGRLEYIPLIPISNRETVWVILVIYVKHLIFSLSLSLSLSSPLDSKDYLIVGTARERGKKFG